MKTRRQFWFSAICNYGLYPVLTILTDLEAIEQYEICADIIDVIRYLDQISPEDKPRPTREEDAWSQYAAYWSKHGQSPCRVYMAMKELAEKEMIAYYETAILSQNPS